jgi:hypothetical protein
MNLAKVLWIRRIAPVREAVPAAEQNREKGGRWRCWETRREKAAGYGTIRRPG